MAVIAGRKPAPAISAGGAGAARVPIASAAFRVSVALTSVAATAAATLFGAAVAAIGLFPLLLYYRKLDRRSE
jgi:hypothetical protein